MNPAPLENARILVTRPAGQAQRLCRMIELAGGRAEHLPLIGIEALPCEAPEKADILIFVSANAVRHGAHCAAGVSCAVAAIGQATASALRSRNIIPDIVPPGMADSESLLAMPQLRDVAGKTVVIVRGEGGRELLADTLARRGAHVHYRECYRRVALSPDPGRLEALLCGGIDLVSVTSVGILEALDAALDDRLRDCLRGVPMLVISDRIAQRARALGIATVIRAAPGDENLVQAMSEWWQRQHGADHDD